MAGSAVFALLALSGCGKVGLRDDATPEDTERASYFREQAKQVFGTDLIRVEPLRDAMLTPEEYSKIRRQLDLRVVASSAPKPGPTLASRRVDDSKHWLESDRLPSSKNESARASGGVGGDDKVGPLLSTPSSRRESADNRVSAADLKAQSRNAGAGPQSGPLAPDDDSIARAAVSGFDGRAEARGSSRRTDGDRDSRTPNSPWEVDVGRDRRAEARAIDVSVAPETDAAHENVPSEQVDIDPAFADSILSGIDLPAPRRAEGDTKRPASKDGRAPANATPVGWSIIIAVFNGDKQIETARDALAQIQRDGRLPDAYLVRRGKATTICYGNYPDAEDATAQADLKRVQMMEINGATPYATTYLCPPVEGGAVKNDLDLRIAKRKYGKDALYTLQVGFYGREELNRLSPEDKKAIQVAAEQAAADLRRDGELAFYYHGAHRSVVTVGIFGADDFNPMNPAAESRRLSETRRRHPLNLYNGQGYTGKTPGMREAKLVPSALVAVPER